LNPLIRKGMFQKSIYALLVAGWLVACNQDQEKVKELETEVLSIHDEVMPKMDDIMRYKKALSAKITQLDSLQQEGVSSNTLAQERQKAYELTQQLSLADSLMMEWMYRYQGDSAKALAPAEALSYFNQEKEKINRVKEQTNRSIQETEEFLK
jgi:predicted transglutaminase-like cysteine proteinase